MKVTKELIEQVAKNARVQLSEQEVQEFIPQCAEILELFSQLAKVDTSDVEPSFQPFEIKNVLREDVPAKSLSQEEALKNAVMKKDGYFMGPKVGGA